MTDFLTNHAQNIVRFLAFGSLFGLLFAIGLESRFHELATALRRVQFSSLLLSNFILSPLLALTIITFFHMENSPSGAMIILAAAPFAPVVPLFVRMARGNLALASALTGIFPLFASILTPLSMSLGFWWIQDHAEGTPSPLLILGVLATSITLPLFLGFSLSSLAPKLSAAIQKPVEWVAEAIGVVSLGFLSYLEAGHIKGSTVITLCPTIIYFECTFLLGFWLGHGSTKERLAIAFGTANRNIGLAILLAASFAQNQTLLGDVLAQSLTLLTLGLLHVALFRFGIGRR